MSVSSFGARRPPTAWRSASAIGPNTFASPYGTHWPVSTSAPSSHAAISPSSLASRLLPTPASPTSSTRCARSRVVATSRGRAASRPRRRGRRAARAARARRRPGGASASSARNACDRLVAAPQPDRPERLVADRVAGGGSVAGPTITWPGSPSFSSRCAVLTTSPITVGSPPARIAPTSTSPVLTPMRICTGIPISPASSAASPASAARPAPPARRRPRARSARRTGR